MRVLLIPSSYPPVLGGLQTVAHTLAQKLQRCGHPVQVVTNRYPRSLAAYELLDGISINRWPFLTPNLHHVRRGRPDLLLASFYSYPATLWQLIRLFKSFQPNVVNVHFPDSQIPLVLWLRRRFNFRLVVSLHGHEILRWFESETQGNSQGQVDNPPQGAALTRLRTVLQLADVVTACSGYLLNKAIELEPQIAAKGHVIHNGIDLQRFANPAAYCHPRPYFLAYGRLSYHKGFDLLLAAFARIAATYPVDLILAGEGEAQASLQSQAQQLGLSDRLYFYGRATPTQVVHLLNGCKLTVIPSRREPFGLVALEAMAAGKPVLATNVGGLPEFVGGPANRLVEPSVAGLVNGFYELLKQEAELKSLSAANRAQAAAYTWEKVTGHYLNLYRQLN